MDNMAKRSFVLLLVCFISFKGCVAQGEVTMPDTDITLWVDDYSATLACRATEDPPQVSWYTGADELTRWNRDTGITIINSDDKYNMTGDGLDFELIIKNLSISDAQYYSCLVVYAEGEVSYKRTLVTVNDSPNEPYPTITQCAHNNDSNDDCHFHVANETDTQDLTCMATHFFPNVTLTWSTGGVVIEPVDVDWYSNDDGSHFGSVTISASPQAEAYVCTVIGEAVRNVASKMVRAVVQINEYEASTPPHTTQGKPDDECPGSYLVGMIVGFVIVIIVCIMFALLLVYVMKIKRRGRSVYKRKVAYSELTQKGGRTVEEVDEKRAEASKLTTGKDSEKKP